MAAYLLVDFDIHDPAGFQEYVAGVVPLIGKHGGKILVSGGDFEVVDGKWRPHRLAIIQFRDRPAIRAFFSDPDYTELNALRQRFGTSVIVAVDGVNVSTDLQHSALAFGMSKD